MDATASAQAEVALMLKTAIVSYCASCSELLMQYLHEVMPEGASEPRCSGCAGPIVICYEEVISIPHANGDTAGAFAKRLASATKEAARTIYSGATPLDVHAKAN